MPEDELTALLTLNRVEGLGCTGAKFLYEQLGSAQEIFRSRDHLTELIPGVDPHLKDALDVSGYFSVVREELQFIENHGIRCITPADTDYPARLRDCNDAPLVLFAMGNADFNARHIVGIVGTRKATDYGRTLCSTFVRELHQLCPDAVVVSGLAYGIDIEAHRKCLETGCPTVGVLAHGLDMIYPAAHRDTARQMLANGGLVTEFMSKTAPLKCNFVRRNRIIAGLSDAVVLVESAAKGGSLTTLEIAESYNRDCFAFPGRVGDSSSVGCNGLIRDNKAGLICSAMDFVNAMNWKTDRKAINDKAIQTELFYNLTIEERNVLDSISRKPQGSHLNTLITECNIPYSRIMPILFELDGKGLILTCPGSVYKPV